MKKDYNNLKESILSFNLLIAILKIDYASDLGFTEAFKREVERFVIKGIQKDEEFG